MAEVLSRMESFKITSWGAIPFSFLYFLCIAIPMRYDFQNCLNRAATRIGEGLGAFHGISPPDSSD
jgi:hypothetical protein